MATDLLHRIGIEASPERIYRAITTEEGIRAWWTMDVMMDSFVGGKAKFGFERHAVEFQMQIMKLEPVARVQWECVGGNSPDWIGTTQEFELTPPEDGEVVVKFCHGGWKSGGEHCYFCNTTWGHLLVCLKQYAQSGVKNPYFK
jgi:uncharacterized protein YndB with AHSA1/START domain